MGWLMLTAVGMIWAAFLLPRERGRTPERTVEEFERNMELLAETDGRRGGRWIVTPQKGVAFLGPEGRARRRARERRKRVFVVLTESIALTLLIGAVPPLRPVWYVTAVLLLLLAAYVWMLLWIKQKGPKAQSLEQARLVRVPDAGPRTAPTRYVTDASSRSPRAAYRGLTVDPADPVEIVIRPGGAGV